MTTLHLYERDTVTACGLSVAYNHRPPGTRYEEDTSCPDCLSTVGLVVDRSACRSCAQTYRRRRLFHDGEGFSGTCACGGLITPVAPR